MSTSVQALLAEANALTPRITAEEARSLIERENALLVDVRDAPEVQASGKIRGALNVSRGMIEFRADAATPYHDPAFHVGRTIILYCASGGRAALAAKALKGMGFSKVHNLGGFKDACDGGFETEPA